MGNPRIRYIEPGTETVADRLAAARDLARCAAAADAEWRAMCLEFGSDPERELEKENSVYDRPRKPRRIDDDEHAIAREERAKDALALEVEELARDRVMDLLIETVQREDFEADIMDRVR